MWLLPALQGKVRQRRGGDCGSTPNTRVMAELGWKDLCLALWRELNRGGPGRFQGRIGWLLVASEVNRSSEV